VLACGAKKERKVEEGDEEQGRHEDDEEYTAKNEPKKRDRHCDVCTYIYVQLKTYKKIAQQLTKKHPIKSEISRFPSMKGKNMKDVQNRLGMSNRK
jgi:uncharacterized protein involved in tellurium resistance